MDIAVPKYLQQLKPYVAGKPIAEVQAQYGISSPTKLASNENPLGPSPKAIEAISKALKDIHRYPDSHCLSLRRKLATYLQIEERQIVLGNGSDEIMALIGQALLLPEEEVITPYPAFSIYEKVAVMAQARLFKVPLKELKIDLKKIREKVSSKTKLIFLTNPHNPTGSFLEKEELVVFLKNLPSSVLVVLDEAYIDFVQPQRRFNSIALLENFPNLIILRTFSKAYGLAGLRIGYGILTPELARFLETVRYPFNVNALAQIGATAALDDKDFLEKTQHTIWEGRQFLTAALTSLGVKVYPSEANFLLIYVGKKAKKIYEDLLKKGIIVRPMVSYALADYLRISIGKPEENQAFIETFKEIWQK
ncbi:MAG: histidinol-phosphate transaminase [Candidatus Desulfofervidaceae bacterium]|nr:histidinol-phosphate transaminase [Candidatus Desulfofervidaceae bacterium]MDL1970638.1 histidinol-phosphate transaminase [Candidatus Desulfofervidaceae bacterium]